MIYGYMPIKQPCMINYLPKRNANVGRLEMFLVTLSTWLFYILGLTSVQPRA